MRIRYSPQSNFAFTSFCYLKSLLSFLFTNSFICWSSLVSILVCCSSRKVGFPFHATLFSSTHLILTKSRIHPTLEYFGHMWDAASSSAFSLLGRAQRNVIRFVTDPSLMSNPQSFARYRTVVLPFHSCNYHFGFRTSEFDSTVLPLHYLFCFRRPVIQMRSSLLVVFLHSPQGTYLFLSTNFQ